MAIQKEIRDKGYSIENPKTKKVKLTGMKAIRLFCTECMNFDYKEIRRCTDVLCPLYDFRFGRNPKVGDNDDVEMIRGVK